jgi:hypothetical protein
MPKKRNHRRRSPTMILTAQNGRDDERKDTTREQSSDSGNPNQSSFPDIDLLFKSRIPLQKVPLRTISKSLI